MPTAGGFNPATLGGGSWPSIKTLMSSRPSSVVLAACASWSSPLRGLSRLAIFCRPGGRSSGGSTRRPPARRNPCRPATAASCPVLRVLISLVLAVVRCCCLHSPLSSFAGCCPSVSADRAIVLHTITVAWIFIVLFHAACGTFLVCLAMTYWYLTTDTMPFYVSIWSLKGTENYRFYGVVFGMVGGMHGVRLLDLIVMSIRGRQLTLWSETSVIRTLMSNPTISKHLSLANKIGAKASQSSRQPKSRLASLVARSLAQMWKRVFSRQGFFGVESAHFSTVYALQELLVASSQTYQTYRASNLLPRSELNVTMVALLVTNCWTTAGFQIFLRKSPELGRVFTFTYDAMVGFAMVTVVPLLIFVPYIQAFDLQYKIFKNPNFIYDPVPFVTMVLENRLMFAASMLDFATKLIPHLSLMLSLVTVSELLGRGDVKVVPGPGGPRMQLKIESTAVKPKQSSIIRKPTSTDTLTPATKSRSPNQWKSVHALLRWKHAITVAVFSLWGAVVLLLHVRAIQREANNEVLGCRARTRPWFSNGKEPCASLVYDCHAHNTTSPNQASFDKLDPVVLATLSIAHCAGLEMPPSFQRLERLMSLHIYNSTIVKWDTKSSISATAHPRLLSVLVGRTQMSEVPQGILQPLPASVIGIQFSHTNLKTLPNDLSLRWHPLLAISFENSELADIPFQMFLSPAQMLSLVGNQIETIPSLAMLPAGVIIQMLELTNNPIKELPATLKEPTALIISMSAAHVAHEHARMGEDQYESRLGIRYSFLCYTDGRSDICGAGYVLRAPRRSRYNISDVLV